VADDVASVIAQDGYRLQYRVWRAGPSMPKGDLVFLNGVMSHSGWFGPIAPLLAQRGFKVIGADRRGTGTNMTQRGDAPSAQALIDDVLRIIDAERTPGSPLYLVGWCWGTVLAINVAFRVAKELAGLSLLAAGLFPSNELKTRMSAQQAVALGSAEGDARLASPISEEMFTEGPSLQTFILRDELRLRAFSPRFHQIVLRMGLNAARRLPQLDLPTLLVLAEQDRATDNEQTIRAFQAMGRHLSVAWCKGSHGMQFDAPEELVGHLTSWIDANATGAGRNVCGS